MGGWKQGGVTLIFGFIISSFRHAQFCEATIGCRDLAAGELLQQVGGSRNPCQKMGMGVGNPG